MRGTKILNRILKCDSLNILKKTVKTKSPLKWGRAKTLGYKNVPGYVSYTCSAAKGGISARPTKKGRKPQNLCRKYSRDISHEQVAVNKVLKHRKNLVLMGSYVIKKDKTRIYYEVLCRDKNIT